MNIEKFPIQPDQRNLLFEVVYLDTRKRIHEKWTFFGFTLFFSSFFYLMLTFFQMNPEDLTFAGYIDSIYGKSEILANVKSQDPSFGRLIVVYLMVFLFHLPHIFVTLLLLYCIIYTIVRLRKREYSLDELAKLKDFATREVSCIKAKKEDYERNELAQQQLNVQIRDLRAEEKYIEDNLKNNSDLLYKKEISDLQAKLVVIKRDIAEKEQSEFTATQNMEDILMALIQKKKLEDACDFLGELIENLRSKKLSPI